MYSFVLESSSSAGLDFPPFETSLSVAQSGFCRPALPKIVFFGRWLLTQRAWQGGSVLSRALPGRRGLIAKVASLTSKRAGLQAQIRDLTEELLKHRSDLKHASMARARAEDKEKMTRKDLKVVEDELRVKVTTLNLVHQEALEAGSFVERFGFRQASDGL